MKKFIKIYGELAHNKTSTHWYLWHSMQFNYFINYHFEQKQKIKSNTYYFDWVELNLNQLIFPSAWAF